MSIGIKVKKGINLHIKGGVDNPSGSKEKSVKTVAVIPDDFKGIIPKPEVHEGDSVKAGEPLFYDKAHPEIKVVSPVNGIVKAIVRGERRKILRIELEVGGNESVKHSIDKVLTDAVCAKAMLMQSGLWAMMTQRPYDIVPNPEATLRDIYVTCFDSAPLAVNRNEFTAEEQKQMQAAVKLLSLLTSGKVYVSHRSNQQLPSLPQAETVTVDGPHPAGNVGTVIAMTKPVNKGETVLCMSLHTLLRIGETALTGVVPFHTTLALTGSEVKEPKMIRTILGASIKSIIEGELKDKGRHQRIISGNALTGIATPADGYLHMPGTQITVIPEGDDVTEFMGWASLSPKKMSLSPSFPSRFLGRKFFKPDARLLGGRRAMIMSGEYDKFMPMDILPEFLIKAILSRDIDRMEQLGIYEVAPEDFALAEYADTSKLELQKIVREGLDYLRKELE